MKYIIGFLCLAFAISASVTGAYEQVLDQDVDYSLLPEDDKMLGFLWKDFGIKSGEKIEKVTVFISTTNNYLGKWTGAFGTSTTVAPSYWFMTDDMNKAFTTKTGSITWEVDSATSKIIQQAYGGELKWGVWWIDCNDFTIDKIVVFTDKYEGGYEGDTEEGDKKAEKISDGVYKAKIGRTYVYKELGEAGVKDCKKKQLVGDIDKALKRKASTGEAPDYWIMTKDMQATLSGTEDVVTWEVTSAESKAMQTQTDGQLKFGVWWIDCGTFTIEYCTITTDAAE